MEIGQECSARSIDECGGRDDLAGEEAPVLSLYRVIIPERKGANPSGVYSGETSEVGFSDVAGEFLGNDYQPLCSQRIECAPICSDEWRILPTDIVAPE